jgi:predicted RNA polymerase sigma factor
VPLLDQDRARWDQLLIHRGLAALKQAAALSTVPGQYALQGEIAACHARALTAADTDWARIATLYEALAVLTPSPIVELNRAVAISFAVGPRAALQIVETIRGDASLQGYHLLPAVRADLLEKLGRHAEAEAEFQRAASLTGNARESQFLLARAAAVARQS